MPSLAAEAQRNGGVDAVIAPLRTAVNRSLNRIVRNAFQATISEAAILIFVQGLHRQLRYCLRVFAALTAVRGTLTCRNRKATTVVEDEHF